MGISNCKHATLFGRDSWYSGETILIDARYRCETDLLHIAVAAARCRLKVIFLHTNHIPARVRETIKIFSESEILAENKTFAEQYVQFSD
jgi:hypothetical protein